MHHHPSTSIIFPVHNESKILEDQISSFIDRVPGTSQVFEIILVENGSTDNSWKIISKLKKKYSFIKGLRLKKASYGQAIKKGILNSSGKYIFIFNVDFYDLRFYRKALRLLKKVDIVIGSKTLPASKDQRSLHRKLTTYFFNVFLRLFLNYPGTDTHGIKALNKTSKLIQIINACRTKNELFDTELIIRANRLGSTMVELPIAVREIRPSRYSNFRRIKSTIADLAVAAWSKYVDNMPENLPIIADDYGLSPEVNKVIRNSIRDGKVQAVSILPNMVPEKELLLLKKYANKIKFSIHINLIEGKPVSNPGDVKSLVDKNGNLYSLYKFLARLLMGRVDIKEIKTEILAQFDRLEKLGIKFDQLDSHQHTHAFPPIDRVVSKIAQSKQISNIRSLGSIKRRLRPWPIKYVVLNLYVLLLRFRYGQYIRNNQIADEVIIHPGTDYDKKPFNKLY